MAALPAGFLRMCRDAAARVRELAARAAADKEEKHPSIVDARASMFDRLDRELVTYTSAIDGAHDMSDDAQEARAELEDARALVRPLTHAAMDELHFDAPVRVLTDEEFRVGQWTGAIPSMGAFPLPKPDVYTKEDEARGALDAPKPRRLIYDPSKDPERATRPVLVVEGPKDPERR